MKFCAKIAKIFQNRKCNFCGLCGKNIIAIYTKAVDISLFRIIFAENINEMFMKTKEYDKQPEEESSGLENRVQEPAAAYGKQRYSYADYLTWPEEKMQELIDGIVYAFSAPFLKHARATASFLGKAWSHIKRRKGKCEIFTAPFDVRLPTNGETADDRIYNVVQPDICVVCDPAKLDERGCIGAPDLVVEVISPSTSKKDLNQKFFLYEKSGVHEYWVVYPNDKAVIVFLLQPDGKYDEGTAYEVIKGATQVPVQTLPGLVIDSEELFEE
jgi:Uma2 family endonuclease